MAAAFAQRGYKLAGFDAKVSSTVLPGSGLSSSAAFEVLIGRILNGLFADNAVSAIEIAQIGQYAENVYFGKPSGLMDQMASSVGGLVFIDFADPKRPIVEKIDHDFAHCGYTLCIIDSGADHADLTAEYAAIPAEMKNVAAYFEKDVLRDVDEQEFYARLADVRKAVGDRAVLRAMHFFDENRRVQMQVRALKNDNFAVFLNYVNESGNASWELLQNITPLGATAHQEMAFTLALCRKLLGGEGAVRVHGGGFAGCVQRASHASMCSCRKNTLPPGRNWMYASRPAARASSMTDNAHGICSASCWRVIRSVTITHLHQFRHINAQRVSNAASRFRTYATT